MTEEALKVHGSIFFLLKKFVNHTFPVTWDKLNRAAGTSGNYDVTKNYPLEEMDTLINWASKLYSMPVNDIKEKFGEWLVPDLFNMYRGYLDPKWTTFQVLENTETIMHGAVRKLDSTANPPVLHVNTVSDKLLIIDYYSKRKMSSLAIGIIRGIAAYYNETDKVLVKPTTDPDDERVQIRVEFT